MGEKGMIPNKILVTGAKGQLGTDLVSLLKQRGHDVNGYGKDVLDITNFEDVKHLIGEIHPDIVIHTAAYTNVDAAESECDQAYWINGVGTRNVAVASEQVNAKLMYVSTDYVFDGTSHEPYQEFQSTSPRSVYGKSKLAGEQFVRDFHSQFFIVRTSWLFGKHGKNFIKTMLKLAKERSSLSVVSDQVGCPTYTVDLAECITNMIETERYGTYHVSNSRNCSWYEFAKEIFRQADVSVNVLPVTTDEFPRPAPRPKNSILEHQMLRLNGFSEMRHWRFALAAFLTELGYHNEVLEEVQSNKQD
jgi:dTDP-4-dehydrorhamnose reductase